MRKRGIYILEAFEYALEEVRLEADQEIRNRINKSQMGKFAKLGRDGIEQKWFRRT